MTGVRSLDLDLLKHYHACSVMASRTLRKRRTRHGFSHFAFGSRLPQLEERDTATFKLVASAPVSVWHRRKFMRAITLDVKHLDV